MIKARVGHYSFSPNELIGHVYYSRWGGSGRHINLLMAIRTWRGFQPIRKMFQKQLTNLIFKTTGKIDITVMSCSFIIRLVNLALNDNIIYLPPSLKLIEQHVIFCLNVKLKSENKLSLDHSFVLGSFKATIAAAVLYESNKHDIRWFYVYVFYVLSFNVFCF